MHACMPSVTKIFNVMVSESAACVLAIHSSSVFWLLGPVFCDDNFYFRPTSCKMTILATST